MTSNQITIPKLHEIFLACDQQISTDTRTIRKGSIFFALKGDRFNGNQFAAKAIGEGASYAIIDEPQADAGEEYLLVDDVLKTLQELSTYHRKYWGKKVIGLTGSNGKTTTKELLYKVLSTSYKTLATEGNLNNHIGVPLTLLRLRDDHEIAVIEMGANHRGEIAELSRIAQPDAGIITNIGKAHLEGFGGEEGVRQGKGELFAFLRERKGKVYVNTDSQSITELADGLEQITYGTHAEADVRGKVTVTAPYITVSWFVNETVTDIPTQLTGSYNLHNILCAIAVGQDFKIEPEHIVEAISSYQPGNSRSQIVKKGNVTIILDAYNANPSSMEAAINNLAAMPGTQKIAVLGDMLELGDESFPEHRKVIDILAERKLQAILVGREFQKCEGQFPVFLSASEAGEELKRKALQEGVVLVKGSRGMKMESLLDHI